MQKVVYVRDGNLTEVNRLMENGWVLVDFKVVAGNREYNYSIAYFVLEKHK